MSDAIKLIGQAAGVVDGALAIFKPNGKPAQIEISPESGHLIVKTDSPDAADRVAAVISALSPNGDKEAAIKAIFPALPAKGINMTLGLANDVSEAYENDGIIDNQEYMRIGMNAIQRSL